MSAVFIYHIRVQITHYICTDANGLVRAVGYTMQRETERSVSACLIQKQKQTVICMKILIKYYHNERDEEPTYRFTSYSLEGGKSDLERLETLLKNIQIEQCYKPT